MLHDLFLMSEYFDPPFAAVQDCDLVESYGPQAVYMALSMGLIEKKTVPCASGFAKHFFILSQSGLDMVMREQSGQAKVA